MGTTGGMELAFRNLINRMYSRDISMKVKSARKTRERRGEYMGGHPFYGYLKDSLNRHHLVVDEEVRPVIERIFCMSAEGMSTMAIAKALNEDRIPSPVELKKSRGIGYSKPLAEEKELWMQASVRKILRDERYTGKMVSNVRSSAFVGKNIMVNNKKRDWIVVDNTHEAIISGELFEEANVALSGRAKAFNRNTNWKVSGNLFVCGCCGWKLQKSSGRETYLYCQKAKYLEDMDCSRIHEDLEKVQRKVLDTLWVLGLAATERVVVERKKAVSDLKVLKRQVDSLGKQLEKGKLEKRYLYEHYREGGLSKEEFMEKRERHEERLGQIELRIGGLEEQILAEEKRQHEETQVSGGIADGSGSADI